MASIGSSLEVNNDLLRAFFWYSSLLVLKMMAMSVLTAIQRVKNKAFANEEDCVTLKVKVKTNPDVERVRRAHLNDLENITLFFVVAYIYLHTNPSGFLALNLIRVYTAARFIHTFVYAIVVIPQPARAFSWGAGYLITGYMAVKSILYFL